MSIMIEANKIEYWSGVGDARQVKLAIEAGFDVNQSSEGGYTAMHAAAENDRIDVVSLLLEHGANPNAKVESGETPVDLAESSGNVEVVKILRRAMNTAGR
jgi:ankyrin repeat protein